jgi:hypothetical protein
MRPAPRRFSRIPFASTCIQRLMKPALLALLAAMVVAGCGTNGSHQSAGASPSVPRFDLSTTHGRAALAAFDPRYLVASASPESIPAIVRPRFDSSRVASRVLRTTDFVIGVSIGGDARAYPVKLLALHEVVNDVVGGGRSSLPGVRSARARSSSTAVPAARH